MATTKKTISVWKALNEKSVLRDRIAKRQTLKYVAITTETETTIDGVSKEDFSKKMQSNFISTQQLFKNIAAYDAAIAQFNASHTIEIGGKTYNVAAAIARHQRISYEIDFLNDIKRQLIENVTTITRTNDRILSEDSINAGISRILADKKMNTSELMGSFNDLRETYIKNNKKILLDPADLYNKLDDMIDELETFKSEYHEAFNRLNVTSMIEVELEDLE